MAAVRPAPHSENEQLLLEHGQSPFSNKDIEFQTPVKAKQHGEGQRPITGALIAFAAVIMVAFEGTMLRFLQMKGVPTETYQFWVCSGKGIVQLASVLAPLLMKRIAGVQWCELLEMPKTRTGRCCCGVAWFAGVATTAVLHYSGRITTAIEMFGIFYMYPIFCALFAVCFIGERMPLISCVTFTVVCLCLVPVIVHAAITPAHHQSDLVPVHESSFLGDLLALVASVAFGAHLLASRFMAKHAPLVPMTLALCGGMLSGAVLQLPLIFSTKQELFMSGIDPSVWLVILLYSVTGGGYYALLTMAVQMTSVRQVSMIAMLDVVLGPLVTKFTYNETSAAWISGLNGLMACSLLAHEGWMLWQHMRGTDDDV